jgi:threonyl-tRNA synthetase
VALRKIKVSGHDVVPLEGSCTFTALAEKAGAKDALACRAGDALFDMCAEVPSALSEVGFLTYDMPEGWKVFQHSASHLLAAAVKRLFPKVQLGIGPAIDEGFYYDFLTEKPFTDDDLSAIEREMKEIVSSDLPFRREELSRKSAESLFKKRGEKLKLELLKEIPPEEKVTVYYLGDDFVDLCRGPHLASSGQLGNFKLLSVAGAYWKGDEHNPMLSRIYGVAFRSAEELSAHLEKLSEAKRRDHRILGQRLGLFILSEEGGAGLVFWKPKGAMLRHIIEQYWYEQHLKHGYQLIYSPHILRGTVFHTSGHFDFYRENMYTMNVDEQEYVLKPMNCPGHIIVYQSEVHSYRDLPLRYAELGTVYRNERSGTLHGLLRVRGFSIDDAHIFCTQEQLVDEVRGVVELAMQFYRDFGFPNFKVELSVRDPQNLDKYAGSDQMWQVAEEALVQVLNQLNLTYRRMEGEAVFYGPKIDIKLMDNLGRLWQATTVQFDFNLGPRFGLEYAASDGTRKAPYIVHRAVLGSMERFVGTLIEHYAGDFPLWLSPVQARLLPIADAQYEYAQKVAEQMSHYGLRVGVERSDEKLGAKIRDGEMQKIPYLVVIGKKEVEKGGVSVRLRGKGDLGFMTVVQLIERMRNEVESKAAGSSTA